MSEEHDAENPLGGKPAKSKLEWALEHARAGYYVFPWHSVRMPNGKWDKRPHVSNWEWAATQDEPTIRRWWARWPDANIAAAPGRSHITILDIDVKAGKVGHTSRLDLDLDHDTMLPTSRSVRTLSGGIHLHMRGDTGSSQNRVGRDLDVRGQRGWAGMPGSTDPDGNRYEWIENGELPDSPAWFVELAGAPAPRAVQSEPEDGWDLPHDVERAEQYLADIAEPAVENCGGDAQTLSTAMNLRDTGISQEKALSLMLQLYNPRCSPPWAESELTKKVANAYAYASGPAGAKSAGDPSADFESEPIDPAITAPSAVPGRPAKWPIKEPLRNREPMTVGEAFLKGQNFVRYDGEWCQFDWAANLYRKLSDEDFNKLVWNWLRRAKYWDYGEVAEAAAKASKALESARAKLARTTDESESIGRSVAAGERPKKDADSAAAEIAALSDSVARAEAAEKLARAAKPAVASRFVPNIDLVANVVAACKALAKRPRVEADGTAIVPCWIEPNQDGADDPPPRELMALRNGLLHWPTGELADPTPRFFSLCASPVTYDPDATAPRFEQFLAEAWPDPDQRDCAEFVLQAIGYTLTFDTRFQVILQVVGPPGCGKGTLIRVVNGLLGRGNFTSPSPADIAGRFGLKGLVGKLMACVTDLRVNRMASEVIATLLSNLLRISGEDSVNVQRKGLEDVEAFIFAKLWLVGNSALVIPDPTNALDRRLRTVWMRRVFAGTPAQDLSLTATLISEGSGILNAALGALRRLHAHGKFEQPASSIGRAEAAAWGSSSVAAFAKYGVVRDRDAEIEKESLVQGYLDRCERVRAAYGVEVDVETRQNFFKLCPDQGLPEVRNEYRPYTREGEPKAPRRIRGLRLAELPADASADPLDS